MPMMSVRLYRRRAADQQAGKASVNEAGKEAE